MPPGIFTKMVWNKHPPDAIDLAIQTYQVL